MKHLLGLQLASIWTLDPFPFFFHMDPLANGGSPGLYIRVRFSGPAMFRRHRWAEKLRFLGIV